MSLTTIYFQNIWVKISEWSNTASPDQEPMALDACLPQSASWNESGYLWESDRKIKAAKFCIGLRSRTKNNAPPPLLNLKMFEWSNTAYPDPGPMVLDACLPQSDFWNESGYLWESDRKIKAAKFCIGLKWKTIFKTVLSPQLLIWIYNICVNRIEGSNTASPDPGPMVPDACLLEWIRISLRVRQKNKGCKILYWTTKLN